MLESLRKGAGTIVAKVLMFFLALSFVAWGVGDYLTRQRDVPIATVGDREITGREFDIQFRRDLQNLQQSLGRAITPEQARSFGLYERTLQSMIARMLIDIAMQDQGIGVSKEALARAVKNSKIFQDETGRFDRLRFDSVLGRAGLTEGEYLQFLRNQLGGRQLIDSLVAPMREAPAPMTDTIYRYRNEERIARYFRIDNSAFPPPADPGDDVLAKFHDDNAADYTAPEFRKGRYLAVSVTTLAPKMAVSKEETAEEYDSRADEFRTGAKYKIQQIIFPKFDAADKAASALRKGGDIATLANKELGIAPEDVSTEEFTAADLPSTIIKALDKAKPGDIVGPVASDFGFHVIKLHEKTEGSTRPLSEVADLLKSDIQKRKAEEKLLELASDLEDQIASGAPLEDVAQETGVEIRTFPLVSARGTGEDGRLVKNLPLSPSFLENVFATEPGNELELQIAEDGSIYVIQVEDVVPSRLKPLKEVRDAVLAAWQKIQQEKAAEEEAKKLAARINAGMTLEAAAALYKAEIKTSKPFRRNVAGELPRLAQQALFKKTTGQAVAAATNGGQIVAQLSKILEADPTKDPEAVKALSRQLAGNMRQDILAAYQQVLQQRIGVSIDREAFNRLIAAN